MSEPLEIQPFPGPVCAAVRVPGSKSVTNRALLLGALADGVTVLRDAAWCDDSQRMVDCLRRLGFQVDVEASDANWNRHITVAGAGGAIPSPGATLHVGNAGTVARFLAAAVTLGAGHFVIDGDARMRQRPIGDLVAAVRSLGVAASCVDGCPPVTVDACGLPGGHTTVSGAASSQFISALLMAGACARSPVVIHVVDALTSVPYVELTLAMMRDFGVDGGKPAANAFQVVPAPYRTVPEYPVEPDASSASYPLAVAAVVGGRVRVDGLRGNCRQGDIRFLEVLREMGCSVRDDGKGMMVERDRPLHGVCVDLVDTPDVAPTLAAVAPFASSSTTIRGIASARRKECDRVSALCTELAHLGVDVIEYVDGLTIAPCRRWHGGVVRTYQDHRMAMAFSLIALAVPGLSIENPGCVTKTFPGFFEMLEELRP